MEGNHGLFIGMTTLDCLYQAVHPPAADEKVVASQNLLVAGGPATNAAVTFAQIGGSKGNQATLLSAVGIHPMTSLLKEDLHTYGVTLSDLTPERRLPPPVSSIVVTADTGERAVIASNALDIQVAANTLTPDILQGVNVILIDGHQMAVSAQIAEHAKAQQVPVVVDAGSWKSGFETVLTNADVVIASANFFPPVCQTTNDVFAYLEKLGVPQIAVTRGSQPILYRENGTAGEIAVPKIRAVDTLGAGDIFHGAFCHFHLAHTFEEALLKASRSASFACQYWGTRDWTKIYRMADDEADEA
ncbi:MAG: PfkB family carbohydrate kinase [Cyanobacteria bacterium P01_D01_bin.105]